MAEGIGALGEDPLGELANDIDREVDELEVGLFKCDHRRASSCCAQGRLCCVHHTSRANAVFSTLAWPLRCAGIDLQEH
jgi:hypothetical protein